MAASHGSNGGNYVGMSLMLLHLGSRQLYMGPKQRPDLFTTAAGADWDRGGSVCFDLLSSWRRGKFGLAFLGGGACGWRAQRDAQRQNNTKSTRKSADRLAPRHSLFLCMHLSCTPDAEAASCDVLRKRHWGSSTSET
jgi:hypothetical protein